nr:PAS domain S-box protein [uncultured Holophaga sp.]
MVQFNTRANEILLKLVYYGPGLSGKTTNLQALHAMCQEENRGELFSVNTQEDRTLFFDLLPINLGYIYGNAIHLQIYTVPGQVQYDASRRVVLGGADGVVFVADSSEEKMQENVDSLSNLYHNLNANRLNIKQIPFVLQYNKRDLADAMPVGVMNRRLNFRSVPYFEATASQGAGVLETFMAIARETVSSTFRKYHLDKKIKDFDEMLNLIDSNIRTSMHELPPPSEAAPAKPETTVLRHTDVSVAELVPGKVTDPQDLLEDALKSNMETARLYSELKQAKDGLEKKNQEILGLCAQLEKANQDNLKTRRYLEGLIQSVGEAVVSFATDGRILTWNAAAEQIFGYSRAEIVGHTFHQLTPQHRAGELNQAMNQVAQGRVLRDVATTRLRKSGVEFPCSITYAPIRGNEDRVLAFSALVRDLGEQRDLEHKVRELEVGSSLARIMPPLFNELANRLSPILLQKGLLLEDSSGAHQPERIAKLLRTVEAVQNLVKPLMMVLSPSTPRKAMHNLNSLLQEAVRRVESESAASGVALDCSLDPALPDCAVDGEQVREAFFNLVRSSVYAAARSTAKRVRIGTRRVGSALQLVSQDTGEAISEADHKRIFELSGASDMESLGLAAAAAVVKAHGGRINVRSQRGIGNAYLLEFPMSEATSAPSQVSGLEGQSILVVDDEPFLLECLVDALESWGYRATPCTSGEEAIRILETQDFDLLVSDIRMPGFSGIQLYDWLSANKPGILKRVLFTTGDAFDPETRAFLETHGLPSLGKPFDLRKLNEALAGLKARID